MFSQSDSRKELKSIESEMLANSVLNSLDVHIAILNERGDIVAVNEAWKAFARQNNSPDASGYLGANYLEVCAAAAAQGDPVSLEVDQGIRAVMTGQQPLFSTEYPCSTPTQDLWFNVTVLPFRASQAGVVIIHQDITIRKQMELSLNASHTRLAQMTAAVPGVVYQFLITPDGEWKFVHLSKGVEDLYEVSVEAALQDHEALTGCILPDYRQAQRETVESAARTLSTYLHDHQIQTPTGKIKWVRAKALPVLQPDGSILWNGILIDITEHKHMEEALHDSEASLKAIFENSVQSFILLDLDHRVRSYNRVASENVAAVFGKVMKVGDSMEAYIFPQDRTSFEQNFQNAVDGKSIRVEKKFQMGSQTRWFEFYYAPVLADNQISAVFFSSLDVTDRKLAEEALRESERQYRLLATHTNDVIWTMNLKGRFTYISPSVFQQRGYTPEEAMSQTLEESVCPGSLNAVLDEYKRTLEEFRTDQWQPARYLEVEQCCKDGSSVWTEVTSRLIYDDTGQRSGLVGVARDITERKRLQNKLHQQATTDEITGIFNRRYFLELAENALKQAQRFDHFVALVILDIDRFKHINDTFGHAGGDQALVSFTRVCRENIRAIDIFARLGGDEFVLMLPETDQDQAVLMLERLGQALSAHPVALAGQSIILTISSGVCISQGTDTLEILLSHADFALYRAKEAGRNCAVVYSYP